VRLPRPRLEYRVAPLARASLGGRGDAGEKARKEQKK